MRPGGEHGHCSHRETLGFAAGSGSRSTQQNTSAHPERSSNNTDKSYNIGIIIIIIMQIRVIT
jgi:hypothetical protein